MSALNLRWDARLLTWLPGLEKELALLRRLVPPGAVCLDVGAGCGTYTVALARLAGGGGRVHAFEPRRRSRRVLRAVCRLVTPGNVTVHPVALADQAGELPLVTPRRRWLLPVPGRSFLADRLVLAGGHQPGRDDEFGGASRKTVSCVRLDDHLGRRGLDRLDFVKLDVEGAELRVLTGASDTLAVHSPVLLCELEERHTRKYGHRPGAVISWLTARGYRLHRFDGHGLTPVPGLVPDENNYLFVPQADRV